MKSSWELIIFDWDGTLIDSEAKIVGCLQSAMAATGLPVLEPDIVKDIIGLGMQEALHTLFPDQTEAVYRELTDHYRTTFFSGETSMPFAGVEDTLATIAGQDFLLAVATGKGRNGLDKALDSTGFRQWFHASRCADETQSKPHPQMLEELLDELDVNPEKALMVGDTEYDLKMAQNAGIASIAVSYGVHSVERLQQCDPVGCVDSFPDLLTWLNQKS